MSFYAPDAVWDSPWGPGTFEGVDAIRRLVEDWLDAFEDLHLEIEQLRDFGSGVGFTAILQTGRPVGSSGTVQLRQGHVTLVESGLVARVTTYPDVDEARAAAERLAEERG